jgi:hypothetical protein
VRWSRKTTWERRETELEWRLEGGVEGSHGDRRGSGPEVTWDPAGFPRLWGCLVSRRVKGGPRRLPETPTALQEHDAHRPGWPPRRATQFCI